MHASRRAVARLSWSVVAGVPTYAALELAAAPREATLALRCVLLLLFSAALAGVSLTRRNLFRRPSVSAAARRSRTRCRRAGPSGSSRSGR